MDNTHTHILLILSFATSCFVAIALLHGAYWDIKTRTAPKEIWNKILPFAIFPLFLWYLLCFIWNGINSVLSVFLVSAILCPVAMLFGYRMGNGGDWRAMFYIALLCPMYAMLAWIMACIFGVIQVGIDGIMKSPQKSAWMISIFIGFSLSVFYFTATIIVQISPAVVI